MKKNISYRDKLLELASIYRISEIKVYTRGKKYLTTPQLEHILKKNKVPIPTEINKSLLEIQVKKISKPVYYTGSKINQFFESIKRVVFRSLNSFQRAILRFLLAIFNGILKLGSFISKGTVNSLNWIYNFKSQDKKGNKIVTAGLSLSFLVLLGIAGFNVVDVFKDTKSDKVLLGKKIEKIEDKKIVPKKKKDAKPKKSVDKIKKKP